MNWSEEERLIGALVFPTGSDLCVIRSITIIPLCKTSSFGHPSTPRQCQNGRMRHDCPLPLGLDENAELENHLRASPDGLRIDRVPLPAALGVRI